MNNKPACMNCLHLKTGWFHPKCGNKKSSKFNDNVRDNDKCKAFQVKHKPSKPKSAKTLEDIEDDIEDDIE